MIWWAAFAAYVIIGAMLIPRFTRAVYPSLHARWRSIQTKETSLREAAFAGWAQSLVWPVFLTINIAVERITAEERAEAVQLEQEKTVAGARAVIARFEAEEKRKWDSNFRDGGLS